MEAISVVFNLIQTSFSRVLSRVWIAPFLTYCFVMACAPSLSGQVPTGNGSGEFLPPILISLAEDPTDMAVVDLNQDGISDVVVGTQSSSLIQVLLSNGDGSFDDSSISTISIPQQVEEIYSGNFDEDDDVDLLVHASGNNLYRLRGNGTGAFESPELVYSQSNPIAALAVGDLNDDEQLDVVISGICGIVNCPDTRILLSDGNGNLDLDPAVLSPARTILVGDIDSDGDLDLVLESLLLKSYLNDGRGSFTEFQEIAVNYVVDQMIVADVVIENPDGLEIPDVICSANEGESLAFLVGQGDGILSDPYQGYDDELDSARDLCIAQLDGEGVPDLVFYNFEQEEMVVLFGHGADGIPYLNSLSYPIPPDPACLQVSDFNGDGVLDVIVASSSQNSMALFIGVEAPDHFRRGDTNGDNLFNIADPVMILDALFSSGGSASGCADAYDTNDDSDIDIGDAVFSLMFLFSGGDPLPAPFPDCGSDPTADALDCQFSINPPCP